MARETSKDPRDTVAQNLEALHGYARRSLVHGEELTESEQTDKAARMDELMAVGTSFKLTQSEMINLIFRGILRGQKRCGCASCSARESRKQ